MASARGDVSRMGQECGDGVRIALKPPRRELFCSDARWHTNGLFPSLSEGAMGLPTKSRTIPGFGPNCIAVSSLAIGPLSNNMATVVAMVVMDMPVLVVVTVVVVWLVVTRTLWWWTCLSLWW